MSVKLSTDQQTAFDMIEDFLDDSRPKRQWIEIEGEAGTGKTEVLAAIAKSHSNALLCTFMNKSASVLSRRTGLNACTLHSAIYRFRGENFDERGERELQFDRIVRDGAWRRKVALLDESGTVNEELARDLLKSGCRVVAMGDQGQLKPVRGRRFFDAPNFRLTEIHRQAWDSPIIRQAHSVRNGMDYRADGDDFKVERHIGHDDIVGCDVILCWRNETRKRLNLLKRAHMGIGAAVPLAGEPLMALTTDRRMGVFNSAVYLLEEDAEDRGGEGMSVRIRNERGDAVRLHGTWIEGFNEWSRDRRESMGFALNYCATVHKYLGSEEQRIILVDEYDRREERAEFLYTGFTRAKRSVIVQRSW